MKPRVAFVVHMLAPYRVSFYNKLFASSRYDWMLFAGNKLNKADARPQYEGDVRFPVSYHKEVVSNMGVYERIDYEGMFDAVKAFDANIIIMFAHVGTRSFRQILNWAKTTGRKVIMWTCYWDDPYHNSGYRKLIRNLAIGFFYKKADYHITYSSTAREKLLKIGYPDSQISIAYNGIDLDDYVDDPDSEAPELLFDQDPVNFLYCGGMGRDKKVELLIEAVSLCLKSSKFKIKAYLIGDGPHFQACQNLINKLNLADHVKLLGRHKQVGKYIKAADCIVLPGTGGLVLNEAVLFNKPFIVSDADGTENDLLINGFNGLKFLPDCKKSLANALAEMAENLTYFQENAAQVREIVTKRSNVDMMVLTFLKVLNKLSHENNTSSRSKAKLYENSTYHKGD